MHCPIANRCADRADRFWLLTIDLAGGQVVPSSALPEPPPAAKRSGKQSGGTMCCAAPGAGTRRDVTAYQVQSTRASDNAVATVVCSRRQLVDLGRLNGDHDCTVVLPQPRAWVNHIALLVAA